MNTEELFSRLVSWIEKFPSKPMVEQLADEKHTPFQILVSTMLSARTRDTVTIRVSRKLFKTAASPGDICELGEKKLLDILRPVGFYRTKTRNLIASSEIIHKKYNDIPPDSLKELTSLPGIGEKTATLVLIRAFSKNDICVDTHVHRITNMWGIISEKTPEKTRKALLKTVPRKYWKEVNRTLVTLGQNICGPVKKECKLCPVKELCPVFHKFCGDCKK